MAGLFPGVFVDRYDEGLVLLRWADSREEVGFQAEEEDEKRGEARGAEGVVNSVDEFYGGARLAHVVEESLPHRIGVGVDHVSECLEQFRLHCHLVWRNSTEHRSPTRTR